MQATIRTINAAGIREIAEFLAARHKLGADNFTAAMLSAWAADAEFQMSEGNTPTIEIRAADSVSGHADALPDYDADAPGALRAALDDQRIAPTVRRLQALGQVSVGMCSTWEFVEL